jgi:hypothetical protein
MHSENCNIQFKLKRKHSRHEKLAIFTPIDTCNIRQLQYTRRATVAIYTPSNSCIYTRQATLAYIHDKNSCIYARQATVAIFTPSDSCNIHAKRKVYDIVKLCHTNLYKKNLLNKILYHNRLNHAVL